MGYLSVDDYDQCYKQIRANAYGSCSVVIFVANDVDALCASKILTVCSERSVISCCSFNR